MSSDIFLKYFKIFQGKGVKRYNMVSVRSFKMKETVYERMSTLAAKDALNKTRTTENLSDEEFELYQVCYDYWLNNLDLAKRAAN